MKRIMISIFLILFFVFPVITNAQLPLGVEEQVSFELSPSIPEPNDVVTLRVTSYLTDLNKANITWYVDGQLFNSSIGLREISFKLGDSGSTTDVQVVMEKIEGGILEKTFSVSPADVDVIRQSLTYVQPFYDGKALSPRESEMVFVAIPNFINSNGTKIPSDQIIFTWNIDGTSDIQNSGRGKDVYYYEEDVISRPVKIILEASPVNSDVKAREIKTFEYTDPKILFYESNPVLGTLYNLTINNNFELKNKEIEITAIPYYFSNARLNFDWKVNGEMIDLNNKESFNKISFRRSDNNPGNVNISLEIIAVDKILQSARQAFNLFYKESSNF